MRTNLLVLLFTMLAWSSTSLAQETGNGREADHQALRALRDKAAKAINEMDFETLTSCLHEEFAFTTVDQSIIRNNQELKAYYVDILSGARYKYTLESMRIEPEADILTKFISENIGYCYGTCTSTYTMVGGMRVTIDSRWSAVVSKKEDQWRIEMVHAGINFLDNPVLVMKDKAASMKIIAVLAVAGVAVLILIAVLRRNKASYQT